jgi:hypothetical protein
MRYSPRVLGSILLGFLSASAFADRAEFCAARSPKKIIEISADESMRLPFENEGGLFDGGVCWWHSRFQRAAWHLAAFDPAGDKPGIAVRKRMIRRLAARDEVVVIPGYANLAEFARENQALIQKELDDWQIRDAFINQAYIRGLSGRGELRDPDRMERHMAMLYRRFLQATKRGEVLWVMLQTRGIESHSSLIRSMEKLSGGGYFIRMVDSNFPLEQIEYRYAPGDTALVPENGYDGWVEWVPYVGLARDYGRIHRAVRRYCDDVG